jgi:hypothetical protein
MRSRAFAGFEVSCGSMVSTPSGFSRIASVIALAASLTACARSSTLGAPCAGALRCSADGACVAGRCRAPDAAPGAPEGVRILLPPRDLAILASRGEPGMPDAIAIGRAASGSIVVLMHFVASWRDDADVASAFLLLEPQEGAAPPRSSTPIAIARILEPWTSDTASWGRQPRLAVPEVSAIAPGLMQQRLRVDVTSIVRRWPKRAEDEHGIAMLAEGNDPFGAVYSTGLASGPGPRLEVYLR